jgi:hypothetical protein
MELKILPSGFSPTPKTQKVRVWWEGGDDPRGGTTPMHVDVVLTPPEDIPPPCADMRPLRSGAFLQTVAENRNELWLWHPGFSLHLDFRGRQGEARLAGLPYWQNVLRVLCFHYLLPRRGLLLHAAGLVSGQNAFIFPGPSGAGKTSIVRQSPGMATLSDEVTAVQLIENGGGAVAHGTPFYGDWGRPGEALTKKVKGIYFPIHAKENRAIPLSPWECLTRLLPCVFTYSTRRPLIKQLFDLSVAIAENLPGFAMHFRPGPDFWEVINAL